MTVFFDLETTGLNFNIDKIIEMSCIKVDDNFNIVDKYYSKFNPEDAIITEEAFNKHGMTVESLKDEPLFKHKASEILSFFEGCDLGGYNINTFDIPFLYTKFLECGIKWDIRDKKIIDVFKLYKKYNSGKLVDVYKRYTGKDLCNAHSADADTLAAIEIFKEQINKGEVFESDDETMLYKSMIDINGQLINKDDDLYLTFGKYKGCSIKTIMVKDRGYLDWLISNNDFPVDMRLIIKNYLNKIS